MDDSLLSIVLRSLAILAIVATAGLIGILLLGTTAGISFLLATIPLLIWDFLRSF